MDPSANSFYEPNYGKGYMCSRRTFAQLAHASAGGETDIAAADSSETDGESKETAESEDEDLAMSLGAACKAKSSDSRPWVQFYAVDHQGQRVPIVADADG